MAKKIYTSLTLLIIGLLIFRGEDAVIYTKDALFLCSDMIIPSLFPFFICSGILIHSGFCKYISQLFSPVMKPLFNINPNGSSAFILGLLSGYPLGAITACQLYETGYLSKSETERLLALCNNSGPLFILVSVGAGLYSGLDTGIILYISHITGAIITGICMRTYSSKEYAAPEYALSLNELSFSEAFSTATSKAVQSILTVCGTIVFFSVASQLLLDIIPVKVPGFVYGIFEITKGNVMISASPLPYSLKLIAASIITGFAGISVHMQVMAVTARHGLSVKPYITGKIFHGLFSGAVTVIILRLTKTAPTFAAASYSTGGAITLAASYMIISITAVVLLCLIFRKRKDYFRTKKI